MSELGYLAPPVSTRNCMGGLGTDYTLRETLLTARGGYDDHKKSAGATIITYFLLQPWPQVLTVPEG